MFYLRIIICFMVFGLDPIRAVAQYREPPPWSPGEVKDPITGDWCCDHQDCEPIGHDMVMSYGAGYLFIPTGEIIPQNRVIQSKDGRFWRCVFLSGPKRGKTRCFIAPPVGF